LAIVVARDVRKTYRNGEAPVEAVRGVSFSIERGEFAAIMGPSGCGKSTLLHLCGAMERASSGRLEFEGIALAELDDDALTRLRRERIGFVFQFFNLLPTLTVLENIALPRLLAGGDRHAAERAATDLAAMVGLAHRARHYPPQLSGGEMQRVAIARAVVHAPSLLIADEPTGNLDSENGRRVLELLVQLNTGSAVTILLATHDPEIASAAHRIYHMRDGIVVSQRGTKAAPGKDVPVAPL
jgi:putative ABC transport system ATP-binding protein